MPDPNIEILNKETLVKAIENSVGTALFRSLLVRKKDSGKLEDILSNGEYSCAFYVSCLLYMTGLINAPRATVKSLHAHLKEHWREVSLDEARAGDVIVWDKIRYESGEEHAHVGFVINNNEAVSTSTETKCVERHDINHKGRGIIAIYRATEKGAQTSL